MNTAAERKTEIVEPDAPAPPIPDRVSDLAAFVADVPARYSVVEIGLFGSRSIGSHRPGSDWDVLVWTADHETAERIVNDGTLQRHFGEFLDLFAMPITSPGCWHFPPWTTYCGGERGWFPASSCNRRGIDQSMRTIHAADRAEQQQGNGR